MHLNKETLLSLASNGNINLPTGNADQLAEKILQFGTGVLLRGLPDYYVNEANNSNVFNGRIVVVKSTGKGDSKGFAAQHNLYTHCIKGIENNAVTESYIINAAISRVVNANQDWQEILACASNPQLQIVISNTTEVGIALLEDDDICASPPQSFPGKLLSFLYERYQVFEGKQEAGMVIIPTELIVDNGNKLKAIVIRLAELNQLGTVFINWLTEANDWCSSLVDRIVPGALPEKDQQQLQHLFGYADDLAIMSEPYHLWAIATSSERTRQILSFSKISKNIIITKDIGKYRELKLRLLNATHTFSCGLAYLSRFNIVNEAMQNNAFYHFVSHLMYKEIIPCIVSSNITHEEAREFASHVINRFSNPFIQHQWLAITMQYTGKMKSRCMPLIMHYYHQSLASQTCMAFGFAAYLLFMRAAVLKDGKYYGMRGGETYWIQDDEAKFFHSLWQDGDVEKVVSGALHFLFSEAATDDSLSRFATDVTSALRQLVAGTDISELITLSLNETA